MQSYSALLKVAERARARKLLEQAAHAAADRKRLAVNEAPTVQIDQASVLVRSDKTTLEQPRFSAGQVVIQAAEVQLVVQQLTLQTPPIAVPTPQVHVTVEQPRRTRVVEFEHDSDGNPIAAKIKDAKTG